MLITLLYYYMITLLSLLVVLLLLGRARCALLGRDFGAWAASDDEPRKWQSVFC